MSKSQQQRLRKSFRFYDTATGHLVLMLIIWVIGYVLFWVAVDTGSILQWTGVVICLSGGTYHLIKAISGLLKKYGTKQVKKSK